MRFAVGSPVKSRITVTATPAHGLFDHLIAAEAAMAGFVAGRMQQHGVLLPSGVVRHVCFVERVEVECDTAPLMKTIANLSWPRSLKLIVDPMPTPLDSGVKTLAPAGEQRLLGNIHAQAFLTYYENSRARITAAHGKDHRGWPETLKIARMVRNACAHSGQFDVRFPEPAAQWRGLTLSQRNHGEQMLYNHLTAGDLILLMLDVEDIV